MGTLDELIHYCKKEHPAGSMVLVGESGCGKTYLIETELREALKDTHFIIRVSLFGINSIAALHDAIKKQWLYSLTPLLSKLSSHPDQIEKWRKVGPLRFPTLSPFSGVFSLKNGPQSQFRGSGEHRNFSDFCLDTPID